MNHTSNGIPGVLVLVLTLCFAFANALVNVSRSHFFVSCFYFSPVRVLFCVSLLSLSLARALKQVPFSMLGGVLFLSLWSVLECYHCCFNVNVAVSSFCLLWMLHWFLDSASSRTNRFYFHAVSVGILSKSLMYLLVSVAVLKPVLLSLGNGAPLRPCRQAESTEHSEQLQFP